MLRIDQRNSTPIYQQLIQGVKEALLRGGLRFGDKMPSVRELAGQLAINPNTIQKAYQELERQGVIESLRGRGTFVCQHIEAHADLARQAEVNEALRKVLIEAHYLGLGAERIMAMVKEHLHDLSIGGMSNACGRRRC
ncbi:MAG: HTH-type transcriptional repressor YtrA [Firmicutes bacterium]|nr:HTH-type transcriptional repressor YtrA [Bacillota bacterium]